MSKSNNTTNTRRGWSAEDRQAFADGNRLRAQTVPNKRRKASREACRKGAWG